MENIHKYTVHPKLLNEIYALSLFGISEKLMGKSSCTRSLIRVSFTQWSDELGVSNRIKLIEFLISVY